MTPVEFLSVLLEAPGCAHRLHLSAPTLAQHEGLGHLYENLPGAVDRLAEVFQGLEGRVDSFPDPAEDDEPDDGPEFIQGLLDFVRENRQAMGDEPALQALVDEVLAVIAKANYLAGFP